MEVSAPAAQASAPPTGNAVRVDILANFAATLDGQALQMPPHPAMVTSEVTLPAGATLRRPDGLLQRYALVQSGQVRVNQTDASGPRMFRQGDWIVDGPHGVWTADAASDGRPARLLLIEHVEPAPAPSAQNAPPSGRLDARPSERQVLRTTTDYQGQPITMPAGPLRVMVYRYQIEGGARLPWHLHESPRYGFVEDGSIEVEDASGSRKSFARGNMIVEQRDVWHRGANPGRHPVSLLVLDVIPAERKNNTVAWNPELHPCLPLRPDDRKVDGPPR
ncbi:Cupin domain protein [Roseateles sp. YR242]|uniref:cupin domain-containing protein n=1 Tax=Roseateles sp. YR242 TaxID=1855305 RepID=UPI0008C6FEE6|nr:cupin domain-containing protein [Roseateles sp. YR242]SEK53163.1 Cupin domain protein [Roseateles sp. YR242]